MMALDQRTIRSVILLLLAITGHFMVQPAYGAELGKSLGGRVENLFAILKQASRQGASYLSDLAISIPFGKIAVGGGALLGIFFLFLRLLIVMGPILILGALTRESQDATDLIRMLIDFYNQLIVSLDEQVQPPAQLQSA